MATKKKTKTCGRCKGEGRLLITRTRQVILCPRCDGEGKVERLIKRMVTWYNTLGDGA